MQRCQGITLSCCRFSPPDAGIKDLLVGTWCSYPERDGSATTLRFHMLSCVAHFLLNLLEDSWDPKEGSEAGLLKGGEKSEKDRICVGCSLGCICLYDWSFGRRKEGGAAQDDESFRSGAGVRERQDDQGPGSERATCLRFFYKQIGGELQKN